MKILFVTWDGPQVTYLESLFLPVFRKLAENGIDFHILQFTWGDARGVETCRQACIEAGFTYEAVSIWRRPVAVGSLFSVFHGAWLIRQALSRHQIDVLMPRSTLPALATLLALRGRALPIVFDADGLPLDERVDFAGRSPTSLMHRFLRDVEAQAVSRASVVMTRTVAASSILLTRAGAGVKQGKFFVLSNGRDAKKFYPMEAGVRKVTRARLGLPEDAPLLVYAGSLGPQYCLDEMFQLFAWVRKRRDDAHFLILTGTPELVIEQLQVRPELMSAVSTLSVSASSIPEYLSCADLGMALRKPSFSMQGVAPIKMGEYLMCGLPVIATAGIGDTDAISSDTGLLLGSMGPDELIEASNWFIDCVIRHRDYYRAQCREVGLKHFSLDSSAQCYMSALTTLGCFPASYEEPKGFEKSA